MEKVLQSKASKNELNTAINLKANTTEVMRAFSDLSSAIDNRSTIEETRNLLNDKISKSELLYYLNSKPSLEDIKNLIDDKVDYRNFNNEINELKLNYDDLNKNFNNKINNFALNKDLNNIKKILDEKANLIDVNNALNKKANKDTVLESLQNKINKNEIEIILNNKLDKSEFFNIKNIINEKADIIEVENLKNMMDSKIDKSILDNVVNTIINTKAEVNDFKLISDAFQDMKTTMTKRIDDIDNDLDRLIENIKTQFQSLNVVINNLENNKVEIGNFEKVSLGISKKADIEKVDSSINKLKNEMFETINEFKNDVIGSRKKFEDKLNEKFTLLQNDSKNILNSINNEKESLQIFYQKKENENENILEKTKGIMDKTLNEINQKISELTISYDKYFSNIKNDLSQKIDITKMNEILSQITNDMSQKISSNEIEELNNIILETNKRIEEFENNYSLELNNKISKKELNSLLNDKISKREISLNEISLLKEQTEKNENEIKTKLDISKFESIIKSFNKCFDNVKREMDTKANSKEIYNIIKNKVEIEDINKALLEIHNELDKKSSNEDFTNAMDNQAIINDTLCNENCLGRWFWKSGKLKNGYAIPWEIQSINTSPDNFIWNKDKTFINIIESGLYELNVGFFNDKKSSIQILVNGDVVINVNPNNNFHNKGKNTNKILSSNGNVVGISFIDFIMLGEQSKIAVSYTGMEGGFGFMGLKKM
jgi:hypothetical protein